MFYDRYLQLCNNKGIKPSPAAVEAGISKSLVSKWKKNSSEVPSMDILEKLAKYFGVPICDLLSDGLVRCEECGFLYNSDDPEEREAHRRNHEMQKKAIEKFGFCWDTQLREKEKAEARYIVDDSSAPIDARVNAQIIVFKALFSRSLMQNDFDLDHPGFESYVAMILAQGKGKHFIPDEIYDLLVSRFGTKEGISEGTYFYVKKRAHRAKEIATVELSNYYQLNEENRKKAQEYIDLLLNSQ